jgi:hypothetical protein
MGESTTQATSAMIAGGMLKQAAERGFDISDDAKEKLELAQQEEQPEAPTPPPEPKNDPVDRIVANLSEDAAQKLVSVEEEMEQEEIEEEAGMPDFEAEAEAQLLNEEIAEPEETEGEDFGWPEETGSSEDRKRAIIAEKKAAYYEKLSADRERKKWKDEAKKAFPHSLHALDKIQAKSRRGFLREAKAAHESVVGYVTEATKQRVAELEAERELAKAEAEAKVADAWGTPTAGPSSPSTGPTHEFDEMYRKARLNNDLAGMLTARRLRDQAQGGE